MLHRPPGDRPLEDETVDPQPASTGLPALDAVIDGLYWGDNVVWELGAAVGAEPFYRAVGGRRETYDHGLYVVVSENPADVASRFAELDVVDARPGTRLAQPAPLLTSC